jgi:hypothetical protein
MVNIAVFAAFRIGFAALIGFTSEFKRVCENRQLDISRYGRQKRQEVARFVATGLPLVPHTLSDTLAAAMPGSPYHTSTTTGALPQSLSEISWNYFSICARGMDKGDG